MLKLKIRLQQGSLLIKFMLVMIVAAIILAAQILYLSKLKLKEKQPLPKPKYEQIVKDMTKAGVLLDLDRTDTLAGIDNDNNGIRDDIDAYIQKTFKDEAQRKAVEQLARASQAKLLVDLNDNAAIDAVRKKSTYAINCLGDRFIINSDPEEFDKVSKKIVAMTNNTKQRVEAYFKFDEALSGSTWGLSKGNPCDE